MFTLREFLHLFLNRLSSHITIASKHVILALTIRSSPCLDIGQEMFLAVQPNLIPNVKAWTNLIVFSRNYTKLAKKTYVGKRKINSAKKVSSSGTFEPGTLGLWDLSVLHIHAFLTEVT